jgi:hypothetical protein
VGKWQKWAQHAYGLIVERLRRGARGGVGGKVVRSYRPVRLPAHEVLAVWEEQKVEGGGARHPHLVEGL